MIVRPAKGKKTSFRWHVIPHDRGETPYFRNFFATENVGVVAAEDDESRARRFRILSFGKEGDDARSIVDMELIWVLAFMKSDQDPKGFIVAMERQLNWSADFEEVAYEAGVDHQVTAYLSGVPLEYVLGDVDFEPGTHILDHPWSEG